MTGDVSDASPGGEGEGGPAAVGPPAVGRWRALGGAVIVLVAASAAVLAVYHQRHSVGSAFERMGVGALALALLFGLIGVGATYPVWWQVLSGLGVRLPVADGAGLFFTTQLGKYVPGAVWPVLMQMEAGRRRGAPRREMLAANLLTALVSCTSGLLLGATILPFYAPGALSRYWWGLLAVPPLVALLHPRALIGLLDVAARLLGRPVRGGRLEGASERRAFGWAFMSWAALGLQVAVLVSSLRGWSGSVLLLSVGAMGLSVALGVLFVPAPAGAGVRDVVLALALGSVLTTGQAIAVVLVTRSVTVVSDLLMAGIGAAARGAWSSAGERTRTSTPFGTRT